MANTLSPDTLALLQRNGYVTAQQAANPASIPQVNGQPDYSAPQFAGLHPLANNSADQAAQQASAPTVDLRNGTNAAGQVNGPPPPQAPQPAAPAPKPSANFLPNPNASGAQPPGQAPAPDPYAPDIRTIPGHEGRAVSPGQEAMVNAGQAKEREANQAGEAAERGQNAGEAGTLGKIATGMRFQEEARAEMEDRHRAALAGVNADIAQKRQEVDSGKPVNYDRWWQGRSTGQKVMGVLAQAFGAFGASLTHTENSAAKIIQGHIDRDIAEQQDQLKNKNESLANARNSLGDLRQQMGDERAAKDAEELKQIQMWRTAGDAESKRLNDPAIAAKWKMTDAKLAQQEAETYQRMHPYVQPQTVDLGKQRLEREKELAGLRATEAGTEQKVAETGKTLVETGNLAGGTQGSHVMGPPQGSLAHPIDAKRATDEANTHNAALIMGAGKYGRNARVLADNLQYWSPTIPGSKDHNASVHRTLTGLGIEKGGGGAQAPELTPEDGD